MRSEFARRAFRMGYSMTFLILLSEMALLTMKCPEMSLLSILVLAGMFLSFYFLREKITRIWPLLVLALVEGVGIWFLPEVMLQKILLLGVDVGLVFTGGRYVVTGGRLSEPLDIPWPIILLGIVSTVSGLYYDLPDLILYAVILTVLNIFFFLLVLYADGVSQYKNATREIRGLPLKHMLRINSLIIAGIFLLMLLAILLGELLGIPDAIEEFFSAIGSLLKSLFYGFVLLIKWIGSLIGGVDHESVEDAASKLALQTGDKSLSSGIIFTILRVLTMILVLYLVLRILGWFLRILVARFHREDKVTVIDSRRPDLRERIRHGGVGERIRKAFSMEERARRIYRKRVEEAAGTITLSGSLTAGDIRDLIREKEGKDLSELTRLYEGVRYGGVRVDRAYLQRMKTADRPEQKEGDL